MSCGVGHRRGLEPALLWLWHRPATVSPIGPVAWEPPYAAGVALKNKQTDRYSTGTLIGSQTVRFLWVLSCLGLVFLSCLVILLVACHSRLRDKAAVSVRDGAELPVTNVGLFCHQAPHEWELCVWVLGLLPGWPHTWLVRDQEPGF